MAKFYLRKNLSKLEPADDEATEALKKWKQGTVLSCEVKKPRNIQYHRMYFAMIRLVFDNQDIFRSQDEMLDAIKFGVGYVETRKKLDGSFYQKPRSISFASMDQPTFEKFFSRSIDVVLGSILPGTTKDEIVNEVLAMAA